MKTILLTGSQGFLGTFICLDLLNKGYRVIGVDNHYKYGKLHRPQNDHANFSLINADLTKSFPEIPEKVDYVIACAAKIGGIAYFNKYSYDLLADNEMITTNTFKFAIDKKVKRIVVLSSSMVFEHATKYPTPEDHRCPPPLSTYGFQKLMTEYYATGALEQYGLEYTIIRPFSCVGAWEPKSNTDVTLKVDNSNMVISHVIPDLVRRIRSSDGPVKLLGDGKQIRSFTNGRDIARAIGLAMEAPGAANQAFNIANASSCTIMDLAEKVWDKYYPDKEFKVLPSEGLKNDVKIRIADTSKAKELLGFEAEISLDESISEVIEYLKDEV